MLRTLARSIAIVIVTAIAILSTIGVATADTEEGSARHTVAAEPGIVSVMAIPQRPVLLPMTEPDA